LPKVTTVPAYNTIKVNQPLQVTITVAAVGGLPAPTGTVYVTAEGTNTPFGYTSPTAQLVNGSASVTVAANSMLLGAQILTAHYSGDTYYNGNAGTFVIQVNSTGTITPTLTSNEPTGTVSGPFPFTVTVSGPSGDPTPTGSVYLVMPYMSEYQTLTNGSAIFNIQSELGGGPNTVTFTYLGDSNYTGGSGTAFLNVISYPLIIFSPSYQTIAVNQPLSLTVTVGGDANIATGTVTLSSGTYTSSPAQLIAGSASFTVPANSLSVGINGITASYSGDSNYYAGSNIVSVDLTAAVTAGLTIAGTAVTVMPGSTSNNNSTINIVPSGGFTGSVGLTATVTSSPAGAQYPPILSFGSTNPVVISGANAGSATLTISTTAATSAAFVRPKRPGVPWYAMGGATLACLLLFGIPARRRSWRKMLGMLALLAALSSGVFACGGGGGGGIAGTTAGSYAITVTGTSGSITSTGIVALTVQ
jgi:hypothetical protein